MVTTAFASDIGEKKGDVPKIEKGQIAIDGAKDAAYDNALVVDINQFLTGSQTGTYGKAYMLWADGEYYLLVEVVDADVCKPTETSHNEHPWTTDSVEIFYDFGNEHEDLVQQFRIDCEGYPSYYVEGGGYYAYGPEDAAEYFDEYAAQRTAQGYNIEMLVNLKDYNLGEGMSIGLQLQINDVIKSNLEATAAIYNMASSMNAGSWDADMYDYITLGSKDTKGTDTTGLATVEVPVEVRGDFAFFDTYPEIKGEEVISVKSDMDDVSGYKGEINVNLHNLASGGNGYCPKMDTCVWYTFEAKESGMYTFLIEYVARNGAERGVDYSLDDPDGTKRVYIDLWETDEHGYVTGSFYAEKGTHDFYVYAPSGMDDSTLKSCDVYWVSLYSTPYLSGTANTEALIDADAYASYAAKRPQIDGMIDDVWNTTESMYAFMYENDQWSLTDLTDIEVATGYTKVLWTEDTLYLLAVIDDVTMESDAQSTTNGINFWVSETYSGETDFNTAPGDWHIFCNADGGTNYYTGNKNVYNEAEMAAERTEGGYIVEVAVPVMTDGFAYSANHKIGYNISVDDDADGDNSRDTFTSWQSYDGRPYWENPSTLNEVALIGSTAAEEPASPVYTYPSSGADGSIINGTVIGNETGWGDNADAGAAAAFDGNPATFFDPLGVGDGFCGIDAGESYILDKVVILSRADWNARFKGAMIQGSNDGENWTTLWTSDVEGTNPDYYTVTEFENNTGYSQFRYFNTTEHGDVAEVEFYGQPGKIEEVVLPGFETADEAVASIGKTAIAGYEFTSGSEGAFGGEGPENLWDGDTATKLCTNTLPASSTAKLDDTYSIDGVVIALANDNAEYGRVPTAWMLSGSNDGENWTEITSGDDSLFVKENGDYRYFAKSFDASPAYSYVKIDIAGSTDDIVQISEVVLTGVKAAVPVDQALDQKAEAPNTFDFGIIAAVASVISLGGFALTKKKH